MRPPVVHGRIEPMGNEYFYEAARCQAPFRFYMSITPSAVNRAGGSLNVRLLSASNELLSVLASFARHPMLYLP